MPYQQMYGQPAQQPYYQAFPQPMPQYAQASQTFPHGAATPQYQPMSQPYGAAAAAAQSPYQVTQQTAFVPIQPDKAQRDYDSGSFIWFWIGLICPIAGLIIWLSNNNKKPLNARLAKFGTLTGGGIVVALIIAALIFSSLGVRELVETYTFTIDSPEAVYNVEIYGAELDGNELTIAFEAPDSGSYRDYLTQDMVNVSSSKGTITADLSAATVSDGTTTASVIYYFSYIVSDTSSDNQISVTVEDSKDDAAFTLGEIE